MITEEDRIFILLSLKSILSRYHSKMQLECETFSSKQRLKYYYLNLAAGHIRLLRMPSIYPKIIKAFDSDSLLNYTTAFFFCFVLNCVFIILIPQAICSNSN